MNLVIYARYSSHSQTEKSIEGQLQTCYEYARANGHVVVAEYIDRAQSGTTDSRVEFQRMIADSDKRAFEAVLVYQLDRFARNRYDSAINKAKLKKNGVRVLPARENISEDASGMIINAQKCLSNGSNPGLGYKVDEKRRFQIDPETAPVVCKIFEMYAGGQAVADIARYLNERKIKTGRNGEWNKNSLSRMLRNKRYIGTYIYGSVEMPGGMPRVIDDELFERVQRILDQNKKALARARGKEEYLLTTKLFCGHCREMMTGYGGTSRSGIMYRYYNCNGVKKHQCAKKVVRKSYIEDRVVLECRKLLTEKHIEHIAASVAAACKADYERLKMALKETDTAIENLWKALESGQSADKITERIEKRTKEQEELQAQIAVEMNKQIMFTAPQIRAFLHSLKKGNIDDEHHRRGIVNIFLRAVYLYDDRLTLILNGGDKPIAIEDIPLEEIEADNEAFECSSMVASAPCTKSPENIAFSGLFLCSYAVLPFNLPFRGANTIDRGQEKRCAKSRFYYRRGRP